jgi:hypothetical protein
MYCWSDLYVQEMDLMNNEGWKVFKNAIVKYWLSTSNCNTPFRSSLFKVQQLWVLNYECYDDYEWWMAEEVFSVSMRNFTD